MGMASRGGRSTGKKKRRRSLASVESDTPSRIWQSSASVSSSSLNSHGPSSSREGQTVVLSYVFQDHIRVDGVSEVASCEGRAQQLLAAAWRQRTLLAAAILQDQTRAALTALNTAGGTLVSLL